MIDKETNKLQAVDALIERKQPFAVFRLPEETVPRLLTQEEGTVRLIYDLKDLNGQKGFVIAPFHVSETCPIVLIRPDRQEALPDEDRKESKERVLEMQRQERFQTSPTEEYTACFQSFIGALWHRRFDKLVLSRHFTIESPPGFSPSSAFQAACRQYVHSYIYLCYTPQTGIWLGSTPEIILSGERNEWNTVALAGTQPLQDDKLPQTWDEKNKKEQEYVTSYIRRQFRSLNIRFTENGPYPVYAGTLSHLKTDFGFSLKDNKGLGDLLKVLHPTPAICGLPKEEAYRFILENEGYDRRYYSGFIGWLNPDGKTDLYVNLRCMHIEDEQLTLYAGGGLLASSELNDEWIETEKKMQTMKRLTVMPLNS
ncbi:isochorismate synthase [Bacteroides zoogleoformans]|uniref:isochorismate synthase n=1 Tax=Bacteroides zoogleoformans TaxID=28119 RepID=A0ABN5IH56_9BACE|nr:isochorismate synthase [Bacteroides zoogleoformans]AVM52032.1 isochorismate synthase [Bacteroides zoogleoformans]TWJ13962.1 isochorismate synthase [Bacteroides zoogleoformans]